MSGRIEARETTTIDCHSYPKYRFNGVVFRTPNDTDVLFSAPRKNIVLFDKLINRV